MIGPCLHQKAITTDCQSVKVMHYCSCLSWRSSSIGIPANWHLSCQTAKQKRYPYWLYQNWALFICLMHVLEFSHISVIQQIFWGNRTTEFRICLLRLLIFIFLIMLLLFPLTTIIDTIRLSQKSNGKIVNEITIYLQIKIMKNVQRWRLR